MEVCRSHFGAQPISDEMPGFGVSDGIFAVNGVAKTCKMATLLWRIDYVV